MKVVSVVKSFFVLSCLFLFAGVVKADEKVLFDLGQVRFFVPFTSVDSTYMWDFVGKQSLVGGETPLASWKALQFTGGAVTSLEGQGTPFLGARLNLMNPAENWVPLASVRPGLFVARDFRNNAWDFGVKFALNVF